MDSQSLTAVVPVSIGLTHCTDSSPSSALTARTGPPAAFRGSTDER